MKAVNWNDLNAPNPKLQSLNIRQVTDAGSAPAARATNHHDKHDDQDDGCDENDDGDNDGGRSGGRTTTVAEGGESSRNHRAGAQVLLEALV